MSIIPALLADYLYRSNSDYGHKSQESGHSCYGYDDYLDDYDDGAQHHGRYKAYFQRGNIEDQSIDTASDIKTDPAIDDYKDPAVDSDDDPAVDNE